MDPEEDTFNPDRDAAALSHTIQIPGLIVMPLHESPEPSEEKRLEQPQKKKLPGEMLSREAQDQRRQELVPARDYDVVLMAKK